LVLSILFWAATGGCMIGRPILGYPHPNPRPDRGAEISLYGFGGGGMMFFYGGGGLSVAGPAGPVGLSGTLWAVDRIWQPPLAGGQFEVAIPVGTPILVRGDRAGGEDATSGDSASAAGPRIPTRPYNLTLGVDGWCEYDVQEYSFGQTWEDLLFGVDGSFGFRASPSRGRTGWLWGFRLGVGYWRFSRTITPPQSGRLDYEPVTTGWRISVDFAGGWRWAVAEAVFIDLRFEPFLMGQGLVGTYMTDTDGDGVAFGAQASLAVAFAVGG
jgi:hypothetical protein